MNNDQLWQAVLGEIELGLSKASFTTWFKNTFLSSYDNDQVVVCVPNTFTKAWLEKKYHKKIIKALENVNNKKVKKIYYKVEIKKTSPVGDLLKKIKIKKDNNNDNNKNNTSINRLGLNVHYLFSTFIVGKGNELAHAACQAVTANLGNAYNPLFIYGGVGLGKTHLLQAVGNEVSKKTNKVLYITSEKFTNDYINSIKTGKARDFKNFYRGVDLLLIDDIQFMGGKDGTQQEFFHTFNDLHQANKQIIITSDRQPMDIPALEKRLLSRFQWGMIADITQPDIETRTAILESKCKEKNYNLNPKIIEFIANNIQNNIRELEGALNRIIAFHEFNNSKPTVDSVKSILNNILNSTKSKSITTKKVIETVSSFFDINLKEILGKSRKKELVYPRQITMYLMRSELNTSYPTIGQELGGRDHTTAMHAYNKMVKVINENEKTKQDINSIKQLLYSSY